jgi:hypothetical protein
MAMQSSKQLAMTFLLGAVLVGGALGFTADRVILRDRMCTGQTRDVRALLSERLALTAEQEHKVDSILDDRHKRYEVVLAPIRESLDSVRLRARAQIRLLLDEDQVPRFDDLVREVNDSTKNREED